jgi:hypothetical protein
VGTFESDAPYQANLKGQEDHDSSFARHKKIIPQRPNVSHYDSS